MLVSGTWDAVGLLAALSGFLVGGGPAILGGLYDRWRWFWLLGEGAPGPRALEDAWLSDWDWWMILFALYFVVVVDGSVALLSRRRNLTCIYNVWPSQFEQALTQTWKELGVVLHRPSSNLFVFGRPSDADEPLAVLGEGCFHTLEVELFPFFRQATLCWDCSTSPLCREVQARLAHHLERSTTPEHDLGLWLTLVGLVISVTAVLAAFVLYLRSLLV